MSYLAAFQLESLTYQTDAVESVVRVFEGTAKPSAADQAGNRCPLTWAQISANLEAVAQRHRISAERLNLTAPAQGQALDVCVEMETGTGKTLVYLRTLYRLYAVYGWNKFIIVVPTVAIRAGVMGTLADFGAQLAQQNGLNQPIPAFEYDSSRLQQLKQFIDSPTPAIMVMNSQAFVGQGRIISNEENEAPLDGLTWLQALARCRPVVVMDEPQMGMDTEAALKAFDDMKPLAKLRYSANRANAGQVTQLSADNGIDGIINEDPLGLDTIYLQAKRWQDPVGEGPVRDFVGALDLKGVKKGVFLTTSYYTKAALDAVASIKSDKKIVLIDGPRLAALMIEHNLGVSVAQSFALKRLDMDFFGED